MLKCVVKQNLVRMNSEQLIEELKKVISILERPLINSNDVSLAIDNLKQIVYTEECINGIME